MRVCDATEQERVRDIFMRLTRLDDESSREIRDTRRRVAIQELVPAGQNPDEIIALVSKLADVPLSGHQRCAWHEGTGC